MTDQTDTPQPQDTNRIDAANRKVATILVGISLVFLAGAVGVALLVLYAPV